MKHRSGWVSNSSTSSFLSARLTRRNDAGEWVDVELPQEMDFVLPYDEVESFHVSAAKLTKFLLEVSAATGIPLEDLDIDFYSSYSSDN